MWHPSLTGLARSLPAVERSRSKGDVPMSLTSRRTLAILILATTLALASPAVARSLPTPSLEASRSPVQQLLQGAVGWGHSLLSGMQPGAGSTRTAPPQRTPAPGSTQAAARQTTIPGSGLDPNGRT